MTRETVSSILRQMEVLRLESYEAETETQERRLLKEYGRLSKLIEPYITGQEPYHPSA